MDGAEITIKALNEKPKALAAFQPSSLKILFLVGRGYRN
jgi:hypothetical protein